MSLPDGRKIDYVIDGLGRRVGKKINGKLSQIFVYQSQNQIAADLDGNGKVLRRYIYGSKTTVPDYVVTTKGTYRMITDQIGTPRLIVDTKSGAVVEKMGTTAFGQLVADTNPGYTSLGFAGGLYDADTKLVHFGARDYDPEVGRFLTKDPLLFKGGDTNLYGYVLNDPINFIDPNGTNRFIAAPILGGVVGGLVGVITSALNGGSLHDIGAAGTTGAIGGATAGLGLTTGLGAGAATAVGIGVGGLTALPDSGANPADVWNGFQQLLAPPKNSCPQ